MAVVGLLGGLILLALPWILIFGLTWVSVIVSPWLMSAFFWMLGITIFILGPLALIRITRGFSAVGLMIASYVFGTCLWITSLLLTYELLGTIAVVVGLVVLGIGIVPIALLATLFHAQWWHLLDLVRLIVATFGTRLPAVWLAGKADADRFAQVESQPNDHRRSSQRNWIVPLSILGGLAVFIMSISDRWLHPNESLSASPTKEPIVKRAELVNPRCSPARASPTATAASHIEEGVEVRRALPLTSGTQTPESAPTTQQAPVNQTTQPALAEAERLLNQTYNDLRLSLSPKNRKVLKVEQLKWRKKRDNLRNNPSEYLRMTEERTQELNHMLTRGEN